MTFSATASIVTFLFLKETVASPTPVKEFLGFKKEPVQRQPEIPEGMLIAISQCNEGPPEVEKPLLLHILLTRRVTIAAGNYASLATVGIILCHTTALSFYTYSSWRSWFTALDHRDIIQILLSIFGVLNRVFQVFYAGCDSILTELVLLSDLCQCLSLCR